MRSQHASVLVGLLWCLALVSVIVIGVLHSGQMDLQVVKNQGDRIPALPGCHHAQTRLAKS